MASVHRDPRFPKGPWLCYLTLANGTRTTRSSGKYKKREAQIVCDALQQAENELRSGDLTRDRLQALFNETLTRLGEAPVKRISIAEWLDQWREAKQSLSASTQAGYEQVAREFLDYLGEDGARRRLESIGEADIRGFIRTLRSSGRSPATINKLVRKYLSAAFTKAVRAGLIRSNPILATDPEKVVSDRRDTFSPEQVSKLLAAAKNEDWKGAILFGWTSGARLLDVANLRWESVDLAHGVIAYRQRKTGRETIIGLHPDFRDWLGKKKPQNAEFVFPTLAGRPANHRNGLSAQFLGLMKAAGVGGRVIREANGDKGRKVSSLSFHSFRHSAASSIFNQAALKEITRRVTGHAGKVVDRYIHSDLEAIRAAVLLIPRLR
jgi:integrase